MNKDEILTAVVILILLFTALINWNIYSWLILVAVVIILVSWYFKPRKESKTDAEKKD